MDKKVNGEAQRYGRSYISGLFGLRALATIAVVAYHLFSYRVEGGYLGVCLFFVLSGFLLANKGTLELSRRVFSIREFYVKRLRRIYPSLLLFVLVTYAVLFLVEPGLLKNTHGEFWSIVLGYHNWWQISRENSYFSQFSAISPFRHIWSLAMEIQFYLIYPFVFFLFLFLLKKFKKKTALTIFASLVLLTAIPMIVAWLAGVGEARIYYGTDMRFYAILFGMTAGFLRVGIAHSGEMKNRTFWEGITYVALALMLIAYVFMNGQYAFTYLGGMQVMCLIMSYLAFAIADGRLSLTRILEAAPLRWIGSRSYEIYLWHYPFVAYLQYHKLTGNPVYILGVLILSLVLAECSYRITNKLDSAIFSNEKAVGYQKVIAAVAVLLVLTLGGYVTYRAASTTTDEGILEEELTANSQMLGEQEASSEGAVSEAATQTAVTEETTAEDTEVTASETAEETASEAQTTENSEETDETQSEAATEETAEAVPGGAVDFNNMTIIGDSVTLGASPQLLVYFPNAYIDAEQSRQVRGSLDIIKKLDSEGHLGQTIVYFLGVNGPFLDKDANEIMDYLGPDRRIFWVNAYGQHVEWQDRVNSVIEETAAVYDNLTVIDWAAYAPDHPEWFYDDGVHLNKDGQAGFAKFLFDELSAL